MSEQEIKAWAMLIAASLYHPVSGDKQPEMEELIEWVKSAAKPIANELRNT